MRAVRLPVAYMPLVDAAPLIVAQEMGFAASEGLDLDLIPAPSWSSVRDMLAFGRVDAAHAIAAGDALARIVGPEGLTIGVPFPFSMHVELLRTWFDATGLRTVPLQIRTVPPPLMAEALASGEIEAFCVGEPWGSVSVEAGDGALLIPGNSIWSFTPEKVLAVRTDWAETEPHLLGRLMRATWRAARWLAEPEARIAASELLSRAAYLDLSPELPDRALSGRLVISSTGDEREVPNFLQFYSGAAGFPWRSQAKWIGRQLATQSGLDPITAMDSASQVFRSDLYRTVLGPEGADLPGASEKVEGRLRHPTAVASAGGSVILERDAFLDGRVFDPYAP